MCTSSLFSSKQRTHVTYCDTVVGGQSGVAVTRLHGNHQDVGSNPATGRNENQTLGDPLHRRWPKGLDRISVEDRRCKAKLDL